MEIACDLGTVGSLRQGPPASPGSTNMQVCMIDQGLEAKCITVDDGILSYKRTR